MGTAGGKRSWMGAACLVCGCGIAAAQSVSEATANSLLSPAAAVPPVSAPPAPSWPGPRPAAWTSLRVVELPAEPGASARARKHHALTWRNDALSRSLGNAGITGADCHNRVRLPSRLRATPGEGAALDVRLQIAIGCSF